MFKIKNIHYGKTHSLSWKAILAVPLSFSYRLIMHEYWTGRI